MGKINIDVKCTIIKVINVVKTNKLSTENTTMSIGPGVKARFTSVNAEVCIMLLVL